MNPRQHLYLALMAAAPRTFREFTPVLVGKTAITPGRVMSLLEKLIEGGYCRLSAQGTFTITDLGRTEHFNAQALAARVQMRRAPDAGPLAITPPRTYGNAGMPSGSLVLAVWNVRGGAEDASRPRIRSMS